MSSTKRSKGLVSFELALQRARAERNWSNVSGLLKKKPKGFSSVLGELLTIESELEQHVERLGFLSSSDISATVLVESEKKLQDILITEKDNKQSVLNIEAAILYGKVCYVRKNYTKSLELLSLKRLDAAISMEDVTLRLILLAAEGYALRGILLEELAVQPQVTPELMESYEMSSSLVFNLIDRDGTGRKAFAGSGLDTCNWRLGDVLELVLLKLPVLYLHMGNIQKSIDYLKQLLAPSETETFQSLRLTAARRLAQILLRGVSDSSYVAPDGEIMKSIEASGGHRLSLPTSSLKGAQKELIFVPHNATEEILLLLVVVETMVHMEAEFSLFPEVLAARDESHLQAVTVYDLLTVALSMREHYGPLAEVFDRAMKFSYEQKHVWRQFSLVLIAAGKYNHALSVLKQCHTMAPSDADVLFDAAKLCINCLNIPYEAADFAKKLVALGDDHPLASRGYLALGVAYGRQSLEEKTLQENVASLSQQAMESLQKARELDPRCLLVLYHLALQHAHRTEIKSSLQLVSEALAVDPSHPDCLHLMALLLSAQKQYDEAMTVARIATEEWPDNFRLLFTQARLEEVTGSGNEALSTCQTMLDLWKQTYQEEMEEVKGSGLLERIIAEKKDLSQVEMASLGDRDRRSSSPTHSLMALSTVSRGDVVSDTPSGQFSVTQSTISSAIGQAWALQAEIWLLIVDIYLQLDRHEDATACHEEAKLIAPISAPVFYQEGLVAEANGDLSCAKHCYESALSIMPNHVDSLVQLGVINYRDSKLTMAEKYLKEAVRINPSCYKAWSHLGMTLQAQGRGEDASNCLFTAIDLESSAPIVPFTTLPRLL